MHIHDDYSIPILTMHFEDFTDYEHQAVLAYQQQSTVIAQLAAFPKERGLEALSHCVVQAKRAQAGHRIQQGYSFDPVALAKDIMFPKYGPGDAEAWRAAITAFEHNPAKRAKLAELHEALGVDGSNT